jgi:Icc-related predicted phosphoesterase
MKQTAVELYEIEIDLLIEKYESKEISKREFITMKHNIFYQAKEIEKQQLSEYLNGLSQNINRVEVIQHSPPYNGRAYTNREAKHIEISLQDNNETLKIFLV